MLKIGLTSISFRKASPKEIISACRDCGIKYIEWGSDIHARPSDLDAIAKITALQSEYGIMTSSYGSYFKIGREERGGIKEYFAAAKALGTDTIRLWCGTKASSEYSKKERAALFEDCKALAAIAEKEGILLATEFHIGTFTDCSESTLSLLSYVDSPFFKTYWQPNQYKSHEENLKSAEQAAKRTVNIHAFNWRCKEKYPLAEAKAEWKEYLSPFKDKERYVLLEFMPKGGIDELKKESKALFSIINEL